MLSLPRPLTSPLRHPRPSWTQIRGTPALHLNEAADGSCCDAGLGLVWRCYWIYMSFVCLIPKKNICFGFLKGQGCVESKNKTSAKRKSTMSSLDPSIIQLASFKCRADVPLYGTNGNESGVYYISCACDVKVNFELFYEVG